MSVKFSPHQYQKKAIKFLLENGAAGLFLEPGLGKTSITLAAIKVLLKEKLINKVLIIAPLRVIHSVWPQEIEKWIDFQGLTYTILHGKDKNERLKDDANIYLINPDGLSWLIKHKYVGKRYELDAAYWKSLGFDMLVIDELSNFKATNTMRFKLMKAVVGKFKRRYGLTGSPAANGLMDLFGQCFMLDQGRSLGQYITHFRLKYFDKDPWGFNYTLKPGADKLIYERLKPLALQMKAEDYLDMPEVITNNIYVDLPVKAFKQYLELEKDFVTKIESNQITASNAAVASMGLRQLASGGVYLQEELSTLDYNNERKWVEVHSEKVEALVELVGELQGSPLLVAYDFKHDLYRLAEVFGKDLPYIGGGVSVARGRELERDWNAGKLPILFAHPQSVGHGLNLQACGFHICFFSLPWSFENYDQTIRRIWRQGNKSKRIFVHHILSRGTIDENILRTLQSKNNTQRALFEGLKLLGKRK